MGLTRKLIETAGRTSLGLMMLSGGVVACGRIYYLVKQNEVTTGLLAAFSGGSLMGFGVIQLKESYDNIKEILKKYR